MPELDTERRDQIAEALAAHEADVTSYDAGDIHGCICGWELPADVARGYAEVKWPAYRRHVADALAPLVAGWLADARADALREAADLVESETAPDDPRWTASLLGYHGEGEWLRYCADRGGDDG